METLFKKTFCDAISETRNKAFGQYELRVNYTNRVLKALIWVVCTLTFLTFFGFWISPNIKANKSKQNTDPYNLVKIVEVNTIDIKEYLKKTKEPLHKSEDKPIDSQSDPTKSALLNPELVDKDKGLQIDTSIKTPNQTNLKTETPDFGSGDHPIAANGQEGNKGGEGKGDETGSQFGMPEENKIYDYIADEPEFQGNLQSFITKSTKYPDKAISEGIEGQVFVCFIVDEKGKVTKPEVLRGIGYGCDEEAIRVVKNLPDFKPGKMNGHPVKVRMRIPLKFRLQK